MKKTLKTLTLLFAVLSIVFLAACSGDSKSKSTRSSGGDPEEEAPDIQDLIEEGVFWLENGEAEIASGKFKEAFEKDPDNPEARFGYAFSESVVGMELISMIIMVAIQPSPLGGKALKEEEYDNFGEWVDEEMYEMLDIINGHFMRAVELYGPLKETGGLSMHFDHLPVYLSVYEMVWIEGEIDMTDVYIFDGMARTLALLFEFLHAHHIKGDLYTPIAVYENQMSGGEFNMGVVEAILAYLLNDSEDFLAFRPDGLSKVNNTRDLLLGAVQDILNAMSSAQTEIDSDDDQSDELFTFEMDGDDGHLMLNVYQKGEATEGEADTPAIEKSVPIISPNTLTAANALMDQIENGGDPVPMDSTIMPLISSAAVLAIGFGFMDFIGFELPVDESIITPDLLITIINGFVSFDVVALDFNSYYGAPKALREMLPAWTNDEGVGDFDNHLYVEWECPEETADDGYPDGAGTFLCSGGEETLVDSDHFKDTPYEIEADGKTVPSPYIAMQDPSFGGLLYVDLVGLGFREGEDPYWREADQKTFNAALGKVLSKILGLIGAKEEEGE